MDSRAHLNATIINRGYTLEASRIEKKPGIIHAPLLQHSSPRAGNPGGGSATCHPAPRRRAAAPGTGRDGLRAPGGDY